MARLKTSRRHAPIIAEVPERCEIWCSRGQRTARAVSIGLSAAVAGSRIAAVIGGAALGVAAPAAGVAFAAALSPDSHHSLQGWDAGPDPAWQPPIDLGYPTSLDRGGKDDGKTAKKATGPKGPGGGNGDRDGHHGPGGTEAGSNNTAHQPSGPAAGYDGGSSKPAPATVHAPAGVQTAASVRISPVNARVNQHVNVHVNQHMSGAPVPAKVEQTTDEHVNGHLDEHIDHGAEAAANARLNSPTDGGAGVHVNSSFKGADTGSSKTVRAASALGSAHSDIKVNVHVNEHLNVHGTLAGGQVTVCTPSAAARTGFALVKLNRNAVAAFFRHGGPMAFIVSSPAGCPCDEPEVTGMRGEATARVVNLSVKVASDVSAKSARSSSIKAVVEAAPQAAEATALSAGTAHFMLPGAGQTAANQPASAQPAPQVAGVTGFAPLPSPTNGVVLATVFQPQGGEVAGMTGTGPEAPAPQPQQLAAQLSGGITPDEVAAMTPEELAGAFQAAGLQPPEGIPQQAAPSATEQQPAPQAPQEVGGVIGVAPDESGGAGAEAPLPGPEAGPLSLPLTGDALPLAGQAALGLGSLMAAAGSLLRWRSRR